MLPRSNSRPWDEGTHLNRQLTAAGRRDWQMLRHPAPLRCAACAVLHGMLTSPRANGRWSLARPAD
jgi:hypothetical protein